MSTGYFTTGLDEPAHFDKFFGTCNSLSGFKLAPTSKSNVLNFVNLLYFCIFLVVRSSFLVFNPSCTSRFLNLVFQFKIEK